jgi:DNA-binding SARP family transcriptional activator
VLEPLTNQMRDIEFRVLGPLEVLVEGRALELKRRKQRSLLALLLLNTGEVVSTDKLIEELWAGEPPKAAVGSLQNLVSALRKQLGGETVETQAPGYRLAVDSDRVDLHRFERLVATAGETEDARRRTDLLREALALWRGPALADLAFEQFAQIPIARLEERRTAAREDLIAAELDLGRHAQLVGELEALVTEHPLRERLRGQLMLALYRAGRQAEALEAYRQARETLVDELGIDPSLELQQLEQAILRHDQELDLPARVVPVPTEPDRRKTVTILFTDVVDSTSLGAALDPEVMQAVMSRYFDSVRTIVERHGGTVEKLIGDAAMAAFGIPHQHEDDALRAVRAAVELRQAINALNEDLQRDHGVAIQIRSAINTGEVLAGHSASGEPFATGQAVNVAMKLRESALPAEIVLGPLTQSLVRDAVATEPADEVEMGGALGPIAAHRVVSVPGSAHARRLGGAALVGRREELERLRQALEQARAENRSRVLTILGEAGVGKSRLALELASSLGDQARFVVGRCLSYGEGATYLPLAEILRQVAPHRPRSVIASLLAGDEDAELIATRLTELTGEAEGGGSTGEVFWAARRLFEALARERPLVVVLEDVHWAEPSMLDLVEYLESWISDAPVLVLCLARPSLLEERPGWGRSSQTIELRPLSTEEAAELVVGLAAESELPDALRERIVTVAEGNALFLEQLHAYLTEDVGATEVDTVPPTVEALLASRLDTLEAGDRAVIERASVIGRDFARTAVLHLSPPEELAGLDSRLATLERRGLVHALRGHPGEEETLRFHHVLIRDVAYSAITKELRADLHERHGSWLEKRSEADELVGYHAEQAHRYLGELRPSDPNLGRLASWGGERLAAAGIGAWKRADTPAAVNLLGRAIALLPPESESRGELLCELGVAQRVLGDFEGGETTLVEACNAAARDQRVLLRAKIELAYLRLVNGAEAASSDLVEIAAKAVPIFQELGDDRALGRTWRHVGYLRGFEGRLADWQEAVERGLVHYVRSGWSASGCLGELAAALLYGPTPVPDAIERCQELLDETTDRMGRANVLAFMSGLEALDGRFDDARRRLTEAETTYEELGDFYARASYCGRVRGRIEMLAGDPAAAERAFAEACAMLGRAHDEAAHATASAELADALYGQGLYDEVKGWLDLAEARSSAEDVSAQYTWRRVRAKALARDGAHRDAQRLAREAAKLAGQTDALSDHGNVLLDLSEVLLLARKESEAAPFVEQGLELFERKCDRPSAEAARARLSELAVAEP